jgi:hypothetical protein
LTFADWFKFRLIEELTYEIDVGFEEKLLLKNFSSIHQFHAAASRA